MGTRADFYLGKDKEAKWLGSIAWDGCEIPDTIRHAKDEETWELYLQSRPKILFPDMSAIKNVSFGKNSGLMIFSVK